MKVKSTNVWRNGESAIVKLFFSFDTQINKFVSNDQCKMSYIFEINNNQNKNLTHSLLKK